AAPYPRSSQGHGLSDNPPWASSFVRWGRSSCVGRVEVESAVGARVECLPQAAAGGEADSGGGFVGECGGIADWVELGGDAAAREDRVPGELPGTGAGPFVAARPGLV